MTLFTHSALNAQTMWSMDINAHNRPMVDGRTYEYHATAFNPGIFRAPLKRCAETALNPTICRAPTKRRHSPSSHYGMANERKYPGYPPAFKSVSYVEDTPAEYAPVTMIDVFYVEDIPVEYAPVTMMDDPVYACASVFYVEDAPAEFAHHEPVPVYRAPVFYIEDTPAEYAPVTMGYSFVEYASVEYTPAFYVEDTPVKYAPITMKDASVFDASVFDASVFDASVFDASDDDTCVGGASVNSAPVNLLHMLTESNLSWIPIRSALKSIQYCRWWADTIRELAMNDDIPPFDTNDIAAVEARYDWELKTGYIPEHHQSVSQYSAEDYEEEHSLPPNYPPPPNYSPPLPPMPRYYQQRLVKVQLSQPAPSFVATASISELWLDKMDKSTVQHAVSHCKSSIEELTIDDKIDKPTIQHAVRHCKSTIEETSQFKPAHEKLAHISKFKKMAKFFRGHHSGHANKLTELR